MRLYCRLAAALLAGQCFAVTASLDWVPARWPSTDPATLKLIEGTAVNCLLIEWAGSQAASVSTFSDKADSRGIAVLGVIRPGGDPLEAAKAALKAHVRGIVLEGDFGDDASTRVRTGLENAAVIELAPRARMRLGGKDPVIGTYQGVWPGIQVMEDGHAKAAPSGAPWIDTNTGFIRSALAYGRTMIWMGNVPPEKAVVSAERYIQVICDAAMSGARWVIALDSDFSKRLLAGDAGATTDWRRIMKPLRFYEDHKEWRSYNPYGNLALVQDVNNGALLSGGIVDMIAVKHTPVRPIPRHNLSPEALQGSKMAVNVDAESLTPEQREALRSFTRGGGTLLTGPPGWKEPAKPKADTITLEKAELERLNDIWRDVQSMIGRKNLGVRLFNVSSMLSNVVSGDGGKPMLVHLVNYSSYPVENVTLHLLGEYKQARLISPEGEKDLELYKSEDGSGVDIEKISSCAVVRLD